MRPKRRTIGMSRRSPLYVTAHTAPNTSMIPPKKNISIPSSISGTMECITSGGRIHHATSPSPADVNATRSDRKNRRANRAEPMMPRETPIMKPMACCP